MRRLAPIFFLVILAAWLVVPASAPAQNDPNGVQIDPNSPSGTEYDIPVERARREAQGSTKKGASRDNGSAPLFGSGIKAKKKRGSDGSSAAGSGAGGSSGGGSSGGGSGAGGSSAGSGTTTATSDPTGAGGASAATGSTPNAKGGSGAGDGKTVDSVASAATVPAGDAAAAGNAQKVAAEAGNPGGGSGTTLAISGALVVVLLGGLAGWLLRRRPS